MTRLTIAWVVGSLALCRCSSEQGRLVVADKNNARCRAAAGVAGTSTRAARTLSAPQIEHPIERAQAEPSAAAASPRSMPAIFWPYANRLPSCSRAIGCPSGCSRCM